MNKPLIIFLSVSVLLIVWTFIYFSNKNNRQIETGPASQIDSVQEFISRKREVMLKDYDSLFTVYSRETTLVYNFRGWTVTLLVLCFSIFFSLKNANSKFIYLVAAFIILVFYILEISERVVMLNLLQELRNLERIFGLQNTNQFNAAVMKYQFRDIRDANQTISVKDIFKVATDVKVLWWNFFLVGLFVLVKGVYSNKSRKIY